MHTYLLEYLFNGQPRTHTFELKAPQLGDHEAAMAAAVGLLAEIRRGIDHAAS